LQEGNPFASVSDFTIATPLPFLRAFCMAASQEPFAAILGCFPDLAYPSRSSSIGLLGSVLIRVAGNIVCSLSQIGSVEFAARANSAPLGGRVWPHSICWPIATSLSQLQRPVENQSAIGIPSCLIRPSVERPAGDGSQTRSPRPPPAMAAGPRQLSEPSVKHLLHVRSRSAHPKGRTHCRRAEYPLETVVVDSFDASPEPTPQ